jgi:ZIP family zinc transporter
MSADTILPAIALASLAGAAIPLGGALAAAEHVRSDWLRDELRHGVAAFGGGALLSAVALVLLPEGAARLSPGLALLLFGFGGLAFLAVDVALKRRGGSAAQMMAMLLDFLPEAAALGALLVTDGQTALLLALLIALQNLPEAFTAQRELRATTALSSARIVGLFALIALLGPLAAVVGEEILIDLPAVLGGIMLFASGGIVVLMFAEIAPQAKLENHWLPPLGAVAGFMLGLAGDLYLG